eukprot:354206-Chlamydomonas_euryale.AAC.7
MDRRWSHRPASHIAMPPVPHACWRMDRRWSHRPASHIAMPPVLTITPVKPPHWSTQQFSPPELPRALPLLPPHCRHCGRCHHAWSGCHRLTQRATTGRVARRIA